VDLEDDVAAKVPRYGTTKRIVSHHHFAKTPSDLARLHKRLTALRRALTEVDCEAIFSLRAGPPRVRP
jgi:3-dehydroquinate dehydratase / shikimate dehydrogenase